MPGPSLSPPELYPRSISDSTVPRICVSSSVEGSIGKRYHAQNRWAASSVHLPLETSEERPVEMAKSKEVDDAGGERRRGRGSR